MIFDNGIFGPHCVLKKVYANAITAQKLRQTIHSQHRLTKQNNKWNGSERTSHHTRSKWLSQIDTTMYFLNSTVMPPPREEQSITTVK